MTKKLEHFETMDLEVIPPRYLQMVVTSVRPYPGEKNKLEVAYQEWVIIWN